MKAFLSLLKRFGKPYRLYFVVGPLCKTIEVIFDLLTPLIIGWMVDLGVLHNNIGVCFQAGALLFSMAVLGFLITLVCQKTASLTSQGIGTDVREALLVRANTSNFQAFSALGSSTFLTRSTNDVNQVQVGIAMLIRQMVRWPALALGSIICALVINVELGLVLCGTLPLIILVFLLVMNKNTSLFLTMQLRLDTMNTFVKETLSGTRSIRSFCRTKWAEDRFSKENQEQAKTGILAASFNALLSPATFCVLNGAAVLILFLSNQFLNTKILQVGQIMALLGYMNQLLLAIAYVANLIVIFSKAGVSAKRILEALRVQERPFRPGASPNNTSPLLKVSNLTFGYQTADNPVLQNISFTLNAGKRLGIIGATGSGKSTLARLLVRLYTPTSGSISFLGKNLNEYKEAEFAKMVSYVPQHATLFSGTVRQNLLWRAPHATSSELEHALEVAKVDFLSGLDVKVEPEGKNFSGGQRQRLALARALVGKANLLILDDTTSALDFSTESYILSKVKQAEHRPAIIQITQRIHTIQDADCIMLLDQGIVAGLGTHDELLKSSKLYKEFYRSQQIADAAEYV